MKELGINLGDRVEDSITGYSGIVVGITFWLFGCVRIGIQSEKTKDDKLPNIEYFDAPQLKVIDPSVHELASSNQLLFEGQTPQTKKKKRVKKISTEKYYTEIPLPDAPEGFFWREVLDGKFKLIAGLDPHTERKKPGFFSRLFDDAGSSPGGPSREGRSFKK